MITERRDAWNILVTSQEGCARELLRELKRHGRFRWSPFRNVLIGEVNDTRGFLDALVQLCADKPFVESWLGKTLPIDAVFAVDPVSFADDAQEQIEPFLDRLAGHTFHVRIHRRGHKKQLNTHELEQHLGAWIVSALETRGRTAPVRFDDPDVTLVIEIVGREAGIALVTRELRRRYPMIRVS